MSFNSMNTFLWDCAGNFNYFLRLTLLKIYNERVLKKLQDSYFWTRCGLYFESR